MTKKLVSTPTDLRADPKSPIVLKVVKDMISGQVPIEMHALPTR